MKHSKQCIIGSCIVLTLASSCGACLGGIEQCSQGHCIFDLCIMIESFCNTITQLSMRIASVMIVFVCSVELLQYSGTKCLFGVYCNHVKMT